MVNPIPPHVKQLWDEWNIRGAIMFSLLLQTLLILFAPCRKRTARKSIILLIWSGYLLADATATFAVGLISNSQNDTPNPKHSENSDLLGFWAPFLLLHLGGPDTITAFALEDNELWLRHFLALIFQAVATGYVFLQTLPKNKVLIPTSLLFVAGIIKYGERTRALYLASKDRFRDSMLKEPDPGPNYAKLMEEYASKKQAKVPTRIIMIAELDKGNKGAGIKFESKVLTDLEVVKEAYKYFNIFRGMIVDLIFSFKERDESRNFFTSLKPEDAMKVIAVELNFIYEALFTKVVVVHSMWGYIFRGVSFCAVASALGVFRFHVKKQGYYKRVDIAVSYALLLGAITLDIVTFVMAVFSDWTMAALDDTQRVHETRWKSFKAALSRRSVPLFKMYLSLKSRFVNFMEPKLSVCHCKPGVVDQHNCKPGVVDQHNVMGTPFLFRRWSECVSCHNLIRYCLKERPRRIHQRITCTRCVIQYLGIPTFFGFCGKVITGILKGICYLGLLLHVNSFVKFLLIDKFVYLCWILTVKVTTKLISLFGLDAFVDEILYAYREPLTKDLWEFIFRELRKKSQFADDPETAKRICSARGEWVLQDDDANKDYRELMPYVVDVAYDQSLLLWHIATELLYNTDKYEQENASDREYSKIISDYMLYLLIMQPNTTAAVAGIGKIRFRDTCAEAKRFFERKDLKSKSKGLQSNKDKKADQNILDVNPVEAEACQFILDVNTDVEPIAVKGDRSKSVLFDASRLAKRLNELKGDKWKILSRVWVELLSYAASHCRPTAHAQQVSKGGELLSFVWLLMAHFGLGDQFQINEGHARAKLIVGK